MKIEESKKAQVKRKILSGDLKGALRITRGFRIEFGPEEQRILQIQYEVLCGKRDFYLQLGEDLAEIERRARELLNEYLDR